MIRLLYFSTARADVTRAEVAEITQHAAEANKAKGITGALAYNSRNFCQVLEGEEQAVRQLVDKIRSDDRHSGFKILDEKHVETRHFPDWSMFLVDDLDFSRVINAMAS